MSTTPYVGHCSKCKKLTELDTSTALCAKCAKKDVQDPEGLPTRN